MGKCLLIYYDEKRDGNIREMIQELRKIKTSPYYRCRSDSEISLMLLSKVLKSEIKRFKDNNI